MNDAAALARADIGIAMGAAGSEVALQAADVALLSEDMERLADAQRLSRRTSRVIRQNLTYQRRSTIITAQLPVSGWHDMIGEPTIADAILDRIVHNAHRIDLKGDSMRRTDQNRNLTQAENTETMQTET